jgi:hypothetical protein
MFFISIISKSNPLYKCLYKKKQIKKTLYIIIKVTYVTDSSTTIKKGPTMEYIENTRLIDAPLEWQVKGLCETATGYGSKLTTRYKIEHNGKLYRVYASCYGNCSSLYIMEHGKRIYLN